MTTTKHDSPAQLKSPRVMHKPRTCRDCGAHFRYSTTHHNPRYCPTCLRNHPRKCATCQQAFHPTDDTDRLCAICVAHPDLFGKDPLS